MSTHMTILPTQETGELANRRFTPQQLSLLNPSRTPRHIAIIPDGNRRWAKRRLLSTQEGHQEGIDMFIEIVKAAQELGVKALTFYAFSTENWNRTSEEINALMELLSSYLIEQREEMCRYGIRFNTIGNLVHLPPFLKQVIHETKVATQSCERTELILAINYGARDELCRAFKALLKDYSLDQIKEEELSEQMISRYLDTHPWGDPDLLIRTSGEFRLSNFLLWQISYAEIHVTPTLWPDFRPQHLLEAVLDYQKRERRWGGA